MPNQRGSMPTAPTPTPAAPAKTTVTEAAPRQQAHPTGTVDIFGNPSSTVAVEKLPPEADASHVTTLNDEEFRKALDLGGIMGTETPEPATQNTEGDVTAQEAADAATPLQAAAPEAAAVEEAEAPIPTLKRAPETPYTVADDKGELELPDLYFNFKANNKDYEKVPLDKLVRFAQMGIYNAEKEARFRDVEQNVGQIERRATMAETRVQELEKFYDKLLADPAYYESASELYQQQNTPEQRIARAEERTRAMSAQFELEREELRRAARNEAQASQLQQRYSQEQENQQVGQFVKHELAPAFNRLISEHPHVNEREVLGQYTLLTAPLMDSGRIPLNRLAELKALVDHDLANWVVALNADREFSQQATVKKVQQARAAATTAKRQVARAAAPVGSPAPMRAPAMKKFETVDEWLQEGGGVLPPLQRED